MKIKKIAIAALLPVVAGVTVSSWAIQAAIARPSAHAAARQVREVRLVHLDRSTGQHTARHAAHGSSAHRQAGKERTASPGQTPARRGAHAKAGHRAHGSAAAAAVAQTAAPTSSSLLSGMSAFERCVAWRESGDNPTASSAGLFGILPSTWASLGYPGTAGQAPVTMQKAAFNRIYAQYGTSPWAPYDGC